MSKLKLFNNESIDEINKFLSTVEVVDVKFQYYNNTCLYLVIYDEHIHNVPTKMLVEELKKRTGVLVHEIAPHIVEYKISVKSIDTGDKNTLSKRVGPAIILEVID